MLKPSAFQVLIKFPADESGQVFALAGQFGLELGPVFTDDLVEQGGLGAVAYVSCRRCWWCPRKRESGRWGGRPGVRVSCECKPVPQTNTGSIRLWPSRSQWPYSQISVGKVRFAGVLRESVVHSYAQLCMSGNGRPGKWLNNKPFNFAISDF